MSSSADDPRVASLAYLRHGWSVIPVRPGQKRPMIAWQRYQEALPTQAEIEHWFARWPDANVAIVTGSLSGVVVIDVDPRHGGSESIAALEREHGPLPATVEARTGGGGRHLYFAHPGHSLHNRVDVYPGVDVRADGGLVVAPPSLHPSGEHYRWLPGRAPEEIALAPLPVWMLHQLAGQSTGAGHSLGYWRKLLAEGVAEGGRNSAIASIAGHLFWHGVDVQVTTELLLCWNRVRSRPPLADSEVVKTVESIDRLHQRSAEEDR